MLLDLDGVQVYYGKIAALNDVTLSVDRDEIVALIGANGAGKTTTLKTISGLRPLSAGRISFDGADISRMPGHKRVVAGIGQAPEGRGIFPGMTVHENLLMGCYTRKGDPGEDLDEVYELFPRLAERRAQFAGTMSGGEQQMLAIGRCLMGQPRLIMFDEPSLGLAPAIVQEVFRIVRRLNEEGLTILLVEQNVGVAAAVADTAHVLQGGRIVHSGPAAGLLDDEEVLRSYLG
jgi:branched-chain amino acid transport system ATP-binding protein